MQRVAKGPMPDSKHGTRYGYLYYQCRCPKCTKANSHYLKYARMIRSWRLMQDPTLAPHGVRSTYINWCCRCAPCTETHTKACREYARSRSRKRKEEMGQEKVTEFPVAEPEGEVAAEEIVKDWPKDVELGAVDPTTEAADGDDEEDEDDEEQDTTVYNEEGDA